MRKLILSITTGWLAMHSVGAHATITPTVPEIDGGMGAIAIGLILGVLALVREHRRKK